MKNIKFWQMLSNISAYGCGIVAIIHFFFKRYILDYILIIDIFLAVTIILLVVSEIMKLILKRKMKSDVEENKVN
jgi:hypothetical protein